MSYSATRIYIIYMVFSGKLSRTNKHRIAAMRRLAQMMNRPVAIPAFLGYIFGLLLVVSIILFIVRPHYAQITNFLQVECSKLFNGDYENTVIFGCVLFLPLWEILRKHRARPRDVRMFRAFLSLCLVVGNIGGLSLCVLVGAMWVDYLQLVAPQVNLTFSDDAHSRQLATLIMPGKDGLILFLPGQSSAQYIAWGKIEKVEQIGSGSP